MKNWHVLVPIKQGSDGKSRLGSMLGDGERTDLADRMARHVLGILESCFSVSQITILSPEKPENWAGDWVKDLARGLNPELQAWREAQGNAAVLIIHADLPLLTQGDVQEIIHAAEQGAAIATDRAGQGTNALAIADGRPFQMCFGKDSLAQHIAQYPEMTVLRNEGLTADLDTPNDVNFLRERGFEL